MQALVLLLTGAALLHISLFTDLYLRYVKEDLRPLLIISAATLTLLGTVAAALDGFPFTKPQAMTVQTADTGHGNDQRQGHAHDHTRAPRVAWLLFAPALLLLLAAPPPLGAYTAARDSRDGGGADTAGPGEDTPPFGPLPDESPARLSLTEFHLRARQQEGRTLRSHPVRMTGLVTPSGDPRSWDLARIVIACCAADSRTVTVRMNGAPTPPADTWVTVTGTLRDNPAGGPRDNRPTLNVSSLRPTPAPPNPYMDSAPPAGSSTAG